MKTVVLMSPIAPIDLFAVLRLNFPIPYRPTRERLADFIYYITQETRRVTV